MQAWIKTSPTDKALLPNLVGGDRWLMYGSDRTRLQQWAERLSEDVVLPADISEVAFKMGLLPAPRRAEWDRARARDGPRRRGCDSQGGGSDSRGR